MCSSDLSIPIPLVVRLPFAVVVIAWAARRDARWLLPVGVLLAMPVLWFGGLALLVGSVALARPEAERTLARAAARVEGAIRPHR